jgi:hypothetical protein
VKKKFYLAYFVALLIVPIALLIAPATFFDKGQSLCLSVLLFDQTCPGCGITRAVQHFIHFDFKTAWEFNKLVVIVFPVLIWVWIEEIQRAWKKSRLKN